MTERLRNLVIRGVAIEGSYKALSKKADVSMRTLQGIVHEQEKAPRPATVLKIALACGLSEEDALELAQESAPLEAKESA